MSVLKKASGGFVHGLSSWLKAPWTETQLAFWRAVQNTATPLAETANERVEAILAKRRESGDAC